MINRFNIGIGLVALIFIASQARAEVLVDERKYREDVNSYKNNSRQWRTRNDHLVPGYEETQAILSLQQKRDNESNDIDGDGVVNKADPSMYDWREPGYQPFGVLEFLSWNHDWNNYKYPEEDLQKIVALLEEAGVSFVRMDFLWEDIEPENDNFVFDKYDLIVKLLSEKNIRILGVMGYCVSWAGEKWNSVPDNTADFLDYVSNVVSRYKDRIKYWEVWNEPDSPKYFVVQDGMKTYTQLLKEVYTAAKKIDPSCKIVLGGMTSGGYYDIKDVYANGGKDYFDIINIHPFVDPLSPADVKSIYTIYNNLERLKSQYGDVAKKIWFTEIGCPGMRGGVSKGWWMGRSPSESEQAQFIQTIYTDVIDLVNLEKVFWAYFRDNKDHFKDDVDYFGLVRWDFSKKPAFDIFKAKYLAWFNLHNYLYLRKRYAR
ncbi:MAG: cellulase family glycosylhydrolase [Candidatus Omnitrophica bacterium]|nr:cellulase family glycosylhydrolase [Candidatus Omnitrophota bacterium]